MASERSWLAPVLLSIAAHIGVFTVMPARPSEAFTAAQVEMRIHHPPLPPPEPARVFEAPKPIEQKKKITHFTVQPKKAEPQPETPQPEPAKQEPEAATTTEVAAPGPSQAEHGEGPAAGNGPMLGNGEKPTTNVATTMHDKENHAGVASLTPRARSDLQGYHKNVHRAVNGARRYPPAAVRLGLEGRAVVAVRIDRHGKLISKRLVESTKHELLDEEALRMVEAVAPYPPLPETFDGADAEFNVPIRFFLKDE